MKETSFNFGAALNIYKKETACYFNTPAAYIVIIVFLLINGYFFSQPLFLINQASLEGFWNNAPLLLTFFIPAVTMRLFAEEFKSGTMEILATFPVKDIEILTAKLFAALTVIALVFVFTLAYPVTLGALGKPDYGALAGAYAGLGLTSLLFASAGVFASTLTKNQVTAFILGFLIAFVFFIIGKTSVFTPVFLQPLTDFIGIDAHMANLARGVIDLRDIVYYLSFSALFLYFAHIRLWARKYD